MPGIVVGFDGSNSSVRAVRWAVSEATAHGATIRLVTVLEPRRVPSMTTAAVWEEPPDSDRTAAKQEAEDAVAGIRRDLPSAPRVGVSVLVGHAGQTLVQSAADADLLVVGSHGRSEVGSVLLGSVSMFAIHHARCPVTVVRPAN
jgi:nucleotide-binding universal stress UspA family protein